MPVENAIQDEPTGRVSTGQLPSPEEARALIGAAYGHYRGVADGTVASYIPALASVSPDLFGVSVVGVNGNVHSVGDAHCPFTIQSISCHPARAVWGRSRRRSTKPATACADV